MPAGDLPELTSNARVRGRAPGGMNELWAVRRMILHLAQNLGEMSVC